MAKKVRLCAHNGRAGKNGVYNVSHNDRTATRADEKDKHIADELSQLNYYWSWNGEADFKKAERDFYQARYGKTIEKRNQRYIEKGHADKVTSIDALLQNPKTCPQETILQIGDRDHMQALIKYFKDEKKARQAMGEILKNAVEEYYGWVNNSNIHVLDYAIHLDEAEGMCHVHARVVMDAQNEKGERVISQNKALEKLGVELPHQDKPQGRFNNRKMAYDAKARKWWVESVKSALNRFKSKYPQYAKVADFLGNFELTPEKDRRHNLEKNDFILEKQREEIAKNARMIEYQEAFIEFVAEEEAEIERARGKKKDRGRSR